ncbi:hypothetical protein [Aquimarina sp. AU119]|uniref:hypothetical protein n=1 Tax=Aquimarina sp. AU119 TaxID=2108528 RepID=UPI00135B25C3|nr:hypothetical protein [Aquimarina sp. AU119]
MKKNFVRFLFLFVIIIIGGYFTHTSIVNYFSLERNTDIINFSYVFNGIFTLIFTSSIIVLSKKFKDQLGFIFMAGSLVKIGVFLLISNLNNLDINKNVFLDFFIAYAICLALEVYCVSKILNTIK